MGLLSIRCVQLVSYQQKWYITEVERIVRDWYPFVLHMPVHEHTRVHLCPSTGFTGRDANSVRINQKTMV